MGTANTVPTLSGVQKAAILMVSIGPQASAEVMKRLSEAEVKALSKAIARLDSVSSEQSQSVMEDFYREARASAGCGRGGLEFATQALTFAFGSDNARRLAEELPKTAAARRLENLQKADPEQLGRFLEREHPQTIALILAHLPAAQASSLLGNLVPETQTEVAIRMADLERVSPEVVHKISLVVSDRMLSFGELKRESSGGPRAIADILNRMDARTSDTILESMQERQQLVDAIRHYMFVFEDLLVIDERAMKEVVTRIDRKLLTLALKGTNEQLRTHFTRCMSQRAGEMLTEDMEAMGPVRIKDVETAQQEILAVVRSMESEGVVSLKGGSEEQYVV